MTILDILNKLDLLSPVKIIFNDKSSHSTVELYNDYDSTVEIEPGVYGELEPPQKAVPKRLEATLEDYDIIITSFEVFIVDNHHSAVELYGCKVRRL